MKAIILEGGEGTGKSTTAIALKKRLEEQGETVVIVREPGSTKNAENIRTLLMESNFDKMTEILLFTAARRELMVNEIEPLIDTNTIVIFDRSVWSTLVYQGLTPELREYISDLHIGTLDISKYLIDRGMKVAQFILDVDVNITQQRIKDREELTRFDKAPIEEHERLRKEFKELCIGFNLSVAPTCSIVPEKHNIDKEESIKERVDHIIDSLEDIWREV